MRKSQKKERNKAGLPVWYGNIIILLITPCNNFCQWGTHFFSFLFWLTWSMWVTDCPSQQPKLCSKEFSISDSTIWGGAHFRSVTTELTDSVESHPRVHFEVLNSELLIIYPRGDLNLGFEYSKKMGFLFFGFDYGQNLTFKSWVKIFAGVLLC